MAVKKKKNITPWVVAGLAIGGLALGLREPVVTFGSLSDDDNQERSTEDGLRDVIDDYGRDYARTIERMIRKETRHFDSLQWKEGNTAGMEATTNTFPYGWSSLVDFATVYNIPANQFGTYQMRENNTNILKRFIRFPNARTFINFLAWFIKTKRAGRPGRWYSLNEDAARRYESQLLNIVPRIVDTI